MLSKGIKKLPLYKHLSKILKKRPLNFKQGLLLGVVSAFVLQGLVHYGILYFRISSDAGKSLYSLGQYYAKRTDTMQLSPDESTLVAQGFQDWMSERLERVDFESRRTQLSEFIETRQTNHAYRTKREGQEYLQKFLKSGGVLTLSGLAYRIISPGSNKKPSLKDWVEVSYKGTLVNGKLIDSTTSENPKAKLPMNGVIPGWTEGLQLIGEDGEVELVVPSELAYGDTQNGSAIPAGSTLVFRIHLYRVIDSGRVSNS